MERGNQTPANQSINQFISLHQSYGLGVKQAIIISQKLKYDQNLIYLSKNKLFIRNLCSFTQYPVYKAQI